MKKFLICLILLIQTSLSAGIPLTEEYLGPTEQLINREGWKKIQKELSEIKIPKELYPLFDSISEEENWGHIGYHGAVQDYRIYQDIIRLTIEEILEIPIPEDFHFLRTPGDKDLNLETIEEFYDFWGKHVDNKTDERRKQLLALNYSIYSNYDSKGSCSIHLFVNNYSKTEIDYTKHLAPFYKNLGISSHHLKDLFKLAKKRLKGKGGILLRLSEYSHLEDPGMEAYNFADKECYPCYRGGYRYGNRTISEEFGCLMSEEYVKKKEQIAPQLRVLINNRYTLNPFSCLKIQRWDLLDSGTVAEYESEIRTILRSLPRDKLKVESYRQKLLDNWL